MGVWGSRGANSSSNSGSSRVLASRVQCFGVQAGHDLRRVFCEGKRFPDKSLISCVWAHYQFGMLHTCFSCADWLSEGGRPGTAEISLLHDGHPTEGQVLLEPQLPSLEMPSGQGSIRGSGRRRDVHVQNQRLVRLTVRVGAEAPGDPTSQSLHHHEI